MDPPTRFARGGFRVAAREEVERAGMLPLVTRTEPCDGYAGDFHGMEGFVSQPEAGQHGIAAADR